MRKILSINLAFVILLSFIYIQIMNYTRDKLDYFGLSFLGVLIIVFLGIHFLYKYIFEDLKYVKVEKNEVKG